MGSLPSTPSWPRRSGAKKVSAVTYDISQKSFYFVDVDIDNVAAGEAGGEALGNIAKTKWNCDPDLVISSEAAAAAWIVNTWRTGGMRAGLRKICPNIPTEGWISYDSNGEASTGLAPARDLLAAHPAAKKILVVGINDGGVLSAHPGGRTAWPCVGHHRPGQDGSFITGPNVNPHLAGSVLYFLEGYVVYAYRDVLNPIAVGHPPAIKDDASDPASRVNPCPVTAEQAAKIPGTADRVLRLLAAPPGTTKYDLFCPKG